MALSSSVLELGQRTRQRLKEERSKRPEIVVLDEPLAPAPKRIKTLSPTATTSRVAPPTLTQLSEKSSVVRLDGLPKDCTPEMIRRFFSGLQLDRIVILPSFEVAVREWGESRICKDRVLVRFPSSIIAGVAVQRSNEYIVLKGGKKVAVTVTIVKKIIGNYLLQNLAIDGLPGESLNRHRETVESKSLRSVLNLLWTMTVRDLNLASARHWLQESKYPWKDTALHEKELQEYYHALAQELTRIQRDGIIWRLEAGDPQIADGVVRLYEIGRNRLEKEIDAATNLILMIRYEQSRL